MSEFRAKALLLFQKAGRRAAVIPVKTWVATGGFLVAVMLILGLYIQLTAKDASLHLKLQHSFHSVQVSVWVDHDLAYSGEVTGSMKRKFGFLPSESAQGSLSRIIPVRAGQHSIRIEIAPDDAAPQEDSISGEFAHNTERELLVHARASGVSLSWQETGSVAAETSSSSGWFSRYAGSLFLTVAGSIASAITGYAIKELPSRLRSSSASTPRAEPGPQ